MQNDANATRTMAVVQALERQRNEALTREVNLSAAITVLQQELQAVTTERDSLKTEVEKLKSPTAEPRVT